jgi:predicted RNA binding protein YcfA (HicA-like mRNA interferase family)
MTDKEKLIRKFFNDRMHITIQDCERLLNAYGYELRKGRGSHSVYHKKGDTPVIVVSPKGKKYVKPGYVNLIIKRLKLEE